MSEKPFRWGIIGPGGIAQRFAHDMQSTPNGRCHAVAGRSLERTQAFADKFGIPKAYATYDELAQDPEVEAVYIATPHRQHFENALLCLQAGKHVLCEKPFTVNAQEAQTLLETATAGNLFLMEALWSRYLPIYQQVRQWVRSGAIGEVKLVTSTFGFKAERNVNGRHLNPELAGGALLDIGIYPIAISQWIYEQDPQAFVVQRVLGETGVDELIGVTLQYPNGALSQFSCSFVTYCANEMMVYGSEGHIRIHPMFWEPTEATLVTPQQTCTVTQPFRSEGFEYQIEEAMRCIRAGLRESPAMTHAHTLANTVLMDKIRTEIGLRYPFE